MARVLTLVAPEQLEIREVELPPLGPGQARLRSLVSGISHGTELNLYGGTSPFSERVFDSTHRLFRPRTDGTVYPSGLGYELVSEVVEVAPDVEGLAVGDVVHTLDGHRDETIIDVERSRTAGYPLAKLPDPSHAERATLLSLGCVALTAVHDAQLKLGDAVVVSGLGTIGLLILQMAKLNGAGTVIAVDPNAARRELAATYGATATVDPGNADESVAWEVRKANGGRGVDTVIDTSAAYPALHAAIASVDIGGRVVSVGFYRGPVGESLRLGEEWHHNRPELVSSMGVWGCPHRSHPRWDRARIGATVADLFFSGALDTDDLLPRLVPFETSPAAYAELLKNPQAKIKVGLDYRGTQ